MKVLTSFGNHRPPDGDLLGTLVKVVFALEKDAWHGHATEIMWAKKTSADKYLVLNVPFYAHGVSYHDTVCANSVQGRLRFVAIAESGGHSTYRIFLAEHLDENSFWEFWAPLGRLGCSYEGATERLLAVDVPPEADIYQAYKLLEEGEVGDAWSFEEGHCGHQLRK